jgi:hypothetical protein
MSRNVCDIHETDAEDWHQTFTRMVLFSLLLLAVTTSIRTLGRSRESELVGDLMAGPILRNIRNWALIVLLVALPPFGWQAIRLRNIFGRGFTRSRPHGTFLLFGATQGALGAILILRAALLSVVSNDKATVALCIKALDFTGGLILPIGSSFALTMLPYVPLPGLRRIAKTLAISCLLTWMAFKVTARISAAHAVPERPRSSPLHTLAPASRSLSAFTLSIRETRSPHSLATGATSAPVKSSGIMATDFSLLSVVRAGVGA